MPAPQPTKVPQPSEPLTDAVLSAIEARCQAANIFCSSASKMIVEENDWNSLCSALRAAWEREERLRDALAGAWLDYDAIPYQMATPEYEAMEAGFVVQHGKNESQLVYKMKPEDVQALLDKPPCPLAALAGRETGK